MEIVLEGRFLSRLEAMDALKKVRELFGDPHFVIAPAAFRKFKWEGHSIGTKKLGKRDRKVIALLRKKTLLSREERQAIAIARERGLLFLTDEPQVAGVLRKLGISFMSLPMLLKALWAKKIATKKEVAEMMERLERASPVRIANKEMILGIQ